MYALENRVHLIKHSDKHSNVWHVGNGSHDGSLEEILLSDILHGLGYFLCVPVGSHLVPQSNV